MRRDVLLYLSGPITSRAGRSIAMNVDLALERYLECIRRDIPALCPQLNGAFPKAIAAPYDGWIALSLVLIERATHVLMLDGWEASAGARLERQYALSIDKPVIYTLEDLPPAPARPTS